MTLTTSTRTAVVTGTGAITPAGHGVPMFWRHLLAARSEPARLANTIMDVPAYAVTAQPAVAGPALSPAAIPGLGAVATPYGRATRLAISAATEALAGAAPSSEVRRRTGVVVATTLGDLGESPCPFDIAGNVADELGLGGPNHCVSTACSAGVYAIALAARAIAHGEANVMLVVGVDALSTVAIASLARFGLLDLERCRPFDADRGGMVSGEGAAALVLESAAHAAARGAAAIAAIGPAAWTCDAHHPTAPEPDAAQLQRAVREAVQLGGTSPDAVIVHRSGISLNDNCEAVALTAVLGSGIAAYAPKAVIGHTAGAAGVFAGLTAALAVQHGFLPPNVAAKNPAPDCGLTVDYATIDTAADGGAKTATSIPQPRLTKVLVSASGFGGNNAALTVSAS